MVGHNHSINKKIRNYETGTISILQFSKKKSLWPAQPGLEAGPYLTRSQAHRRYMACMVKRKLTAFHEYKQTANFNNIILHIFYSSS